MKIDHIGIAVKSIAEAAQVYEQALGLTVAGYDQVDEQGVRLAMLKIGESYIELLESIQPDSPIEEALERVKASGARLIDSKPRRGAHNTRTAFIHPSSTHGVLLELVEHGG